MLLFLGLPLVVTAQTPGADSASANPFKIDPAAYDFAQNPKLLDRIKSSPHGFFRFINVRFSSEVCRRFGTTLVGTPMFNLHGDAHIEQYAITDLGRGLTDFDDSCTGPAILDIMRFGVSLRLACNMLGWQDEAENLFDTFLLAYQQTLNNPDYEAPEPSLAKKIRSSFRFDRKAYFEWVSSIMQPVEYAEQEALYKAMQPYFDGLMAEQNIDRSYFRVRQIGRLQMGIGSALDVKYLVRIHGESADPMDDLVLEIKEVRDLSGIECITSAQQFNPFRILVGQARIAYQPFRHLGFFTFRDMVFWVHSWVMNYKELEIGKSYKSPSQLAEVAYDVGVQLGRGHTKHIADPFGVQLRRAQLRYLAEQSVYLHAQSREMTEQVIAAWQQFCTRVDNQSP